MMLDQALPHGPIGREARTRRPSGRAGVGRPVGRYAAGKAIADRALAALLLVLAAPVILAAAVAVRLTSRGPVIYTQARVGRGGRAFTIFKLRTMVADSERLTGPTWAVPADRRVTPVGRFLRRSHLDELPQLWNVLRGEMSLVGPRPERPEIVAQLERAIPRYRERLAMPPGLTGLAQVHLPPDVALDDVRRKLAYDLFYIRNAGPGLDLLLLLSTAGFLAGIPFRMSSRLLPLPDGRAVGEAEPELLAGIDPSPRRQTARPPVAAAGPLEGRPWASP